ncbi:MAG: hypothetical protein QOH43_558 [Solirubrobacteraceae bacterium]|jgi:hypothetical protein|nr:hypothetical protein [Solirubrobacteraceae bacterium]
MRKRRLLAATAVATFGLTSSAWAVNADQTITVKVSPTKAGTKKKPANVKLTIQTDTKPLDATPFGNKLVTIHFDKNLVFNPKKFKTCSAQTVQANESQCPKGSKVGGGTGVGTALGIISNLTVSTYNGPNGLFLLHITAPGPPQVDGVIQASLKKDTGKYGSKLVLPVPDNLQQPVPGVFAVLLKFITATKGTSKGVPYVGLTGCPSNGKLSFKGDFTYTDGTSKTATATVPCKK